MRRHGHADVHGEWYGMPSRPCLRCKADVCIDCARPQGAELICYLCEGDEREATTCTECSNFGHSSVQSSSRHSLEF